MQKFSIVLLSVLAASAYGVMHEQITARICLKYFTVAHPLIFPTSSTTLLALCWGVAAAGGMGLVLGSLLAVISQSGGPPPWPIVRLFRSILLLLVVMSVAAVSTGLIGYILSGRGVIFLPRDLAAAIPVQEHDRFMAVWLAHCASYLVGLAGAGVLCFKVWAARGRPPVISLFPRNQSAIIRAIFLAPLVGCIFWCRFMTR